MKLLPLLLFLSGCSWLNDYGHCTVTWTCDECSDVEVEFEYVKTLDQKEADVPL